MPGEPAAPLKRRSRRRRLLRFIAAVVLLGMIVLPLAIWLAYVNRVTLTNRALAMLEAYDVTVETVDINGDGRLDIEGLSIKNRETAHEILHIPSLAVTPGWREIASGNIGTLVIKEPKIDLEEEQIRAWMTTSEQLDAGEVIPTRPQPFIFGKVEISDAILGLQMEDQSRVQLNLNYQAANVTRDDEGRLNSGEQTLTITQGRFESDQLHEDTPSPLSLEKLEIRGQIKDNIVLLDELHLDRPVIHLSPAVFNLWQSQVASVATPAEDKTQPVKAAKESEAAPASMPLIAGFEIRSIKITGAEVEGAKFDHGDGNTSGWYLPDIHFEMDYDAANLAWRSNGGVSMDHQKLVLRDVGLRAHGQGDGHVRIPEVKAELESAKDLQHLVFQELSFKDPDVNWTDELLLSFQAPKNEAGTKPLPTDSVPDPSEETPQETSAWQATIQNGAIHGGILRLASRSLMDFDVHSNVELVVSSLKFGSDGWSSSAEQSLKVKDTSLQFPSAKKQDTSNSSPFFELPSGELALVPDRWNADYHVSRLALNKPLLRLREGNTPWLQKAGSTATTSEKSYESTAAAAPAPEALELPWWQRLHFDHLSLEGGVSDLLVHAVEPVEARGKIEITTLEHDGETAHRVRFEDFEARLPTLSRLPFPVANASLFEVVLTLPDVWSTRRVESLKLDGVHFEAGEALVGLMDSQEKAAAESAKADPKTAATAPETETEPQRGPFSSRRRPWRVGELDVTNSSVTIVNLVPGLPAVKFNLEYHAQDTPLLAEDLARNLVPQRIELANLTIPSPYEPLRPVAELDSIFIHFTLQGLLSKQIEKIEIVSPTLYVGEDLFWYVDYYRKYVNENSKPGADGTEMVADDKKFALQATSALLDEEPAPAEAAWSIERLQVHSGKLILAPKGKPLKGFGKPLPFNINTEVVRGTLEAELEIPSDVYTLDDYKLELDGMSGHVRFNLPVRQKDNNLVETFEVDRIRWKELQTGKAYLSVTYDVGGIYAKFGAEAYEGYVNGELNVYNDDSYTWDGWIGGKKVQTNELTQKLFPTYFFMKGNVDVTVVAQGNMHELFQADGSFKNDTPGKFSITALNDAVEKLPGDWTQLEKQLTQIGVETLRDFEYDDAEAKFRLYGREGNGHVLFTGPQGSRKFEINVFDHRWTTDEKPLTTTE